MSSQGRRPVRGVAALVSSYHPDDRLAAVCASLAGQVDVVVVVDDGTGHSADAVLAACTAAGALVVRHPENRGIGAALCTAAARAADGPQRPTWFLTVDQDSVVPDGYVDALLAAAAAARDAGLDPALVGPAHVEDVGSRVAGRDGDVLLGREPLQSGLLVAADLAPAPGGLPFDAGLFIDGVDTEVYLRARTTGRAVVVAPGTRLGHRLGTVADAGAGLRLVHAAPFRYYYIARNRVHLVRRYGRRAPSWAAGAVLRDLRHLAVTSLLVPGRRARWRATLRGAVDGLRGVVGPDPERVGPRQPSPPRPEHDAPHER
ncbi:glycosyltransferase [Cellulomonas sp. S1-8]|uniref:glycosyltransferase n=1 Tax=Cellulomonas sp. S1-8 TaxID=2904790 RepID=UPI002242D506|nr:glycosyltransferase [Cellulomonas sp. S1-8]UZN01908.1 glycosyltransferase [Cellulomonas sp. S1-8]